ncbi:hypothetical protein BB560_006298, partial [Smittium megazygosporum]
PFGLSGRPESDRSLVRFLAATDLSSIKSKLFTTKMNNELQQTVVHLQQQVEALSAALKQMGIGNTSFQADEVLQERIYADECESYKYMSRL